MDEDILIYWPQELKEGLWGYKHWINMDNPTGVVHMNKDGKYIFLYKKEEPNKYFKYDLSDNCFYRVNIYKTTGTKVTKTKASNIRQWFYKHKIVTDDPLFARIFLYNKSDSRLSSYRNPVRYIEAFNRYEAKALEEWYNAGITLSDVEKMFDHACNSSTADAGYHGYRRISCRPCEFDKSILRVMKQIDGISYSALDSFRYMSEENFIIFQKLLKYSQKPEYDGVFDFEARDTIYNIFEFNTYQSQSTRERLIDVIKEFNIDIDALCRFLMRLKRVEGCDLNDLTDGFHYRDYLRMEKELNNENLSKIDKYPKNWLTTFRRTKRNYNDIKKRIDEDKFKKQIEKNENLLYKDRTFSIILPQKSNDVRKEGSILKHCVASYVDRITNGQTCILFCRQNEDVDEPYVTVEVKNHAITQAYGYQDSKPPVDALKFLAKWAKKKNLKLAWAWEKEFKNNRGR